MPAPLPPLLSTRAAGDCVLARGAMLFVAALEGEALARAKFQFAGLALVDAVLGGGGVRICAAMGLAVLGTR